MNSRTAKLLRKFSVVSGIAYRPLKKSWQKYPRNKRHRERLMVKENL